MDLGWGIIGTGSIAERMAPSIQRAADSCLVAILSRDKARAREFATRHEASGYYDSLDEFLRCPGLDVVYISSPNALHAPQCIQAARSEKHVLVEKPMALIVPECKAMIEACRKNHVRLGVNFMFRRHPAYVEMRRLVQNGEAGKVLVVKATSTIPSRVMPEWYDSPQTAGGGVMMMIGVHMIDLFRFLLGAEVNEAVAFVGGETAEHPFDHNVTAMLKFDEATYGMLDCTIGTTHTSRDVTIYGTKFTLWGKNTLLSGSGVSELHLMDEFNDRVTAYDNSQIYIAQVETFTRAVLNNEEPDASGLDGLRVVETTRALFESNRLRKTVKVKHIVEGAT